MQMVTWQQYRFSRKSGLYLQPDRQHAVQVPQTVIEKANSKKIPVFGSEIEVKPDVWRKEWELTILNLKKPRCYS